MKMFRFLIILFIILIVSSITSYANEQLIIEPDAGRAPLLSAINNAKSSVDLVMYGLTDMRFVNALIQAKKSGKKIETLLEPSPYQSENENTFAIKRLKTANISLYWTNPIFKLTHQKTFLIDDHEAIIMTFNLTHSSFKNQRNFALITDDPGIIQEIKQVFIADTQKNNITTNSPNLIWSPNNSRQKISEFIKSTQSDIKIYAQNLTDYELIGLLAKQARAGKKVEILTSENNNKSNKKFDYLRKAGVIIRYDHQYIIHAKVIILDHNRALLGSINLTQPSLNNNRELSITTRDTRVVDQLIKTFDSDWQEASEK